MADKVQIDTVALDKLIRSFQTKNFVRVGILGDNTIRTKGGGNVSNADVGAVHEFGSFSPPIPQRSFLRVPLMEHLAEKLEKSEGFDEASLKEVVKSGTIKQWLKKIAAAAEATVLEAFKTSGYGRWAQWAPGYSNRTEQILVDSQQLMKSITAVVK